MRLQPADQFLLTKTVTDSPLCQVLHGILTGQDPVCSPRDQDAVHRFRYLLARYSSAFEQGDWEQMMLSQQK